MPLTEPVPRNLIHERSIVCRGFHRDDGLWDIEGHLVDTKTYPFANRHRGEIRAGEPIHEMWLRLTIDEDLLVHAAEAATEHAPYAVCPRITPNFEQLAGLRIGPGWTRAVRQRFGGVTGCTHLVELLGPIATTAYQALAGQREKRPSDKPAKRPFFLDTCHALAADGEVVRSHWPQFYTGPEGRTGR